MRIHAMRSVKFFSIVSVLLVSSFFTTTLFAQSDSECTPDFEKYVIIIDTSGSVDNTEFAFFRSASDAMVDNVLDGSRNAQVAIVQYNTAERGGSGSHGYDVVVPFTDVADDAKGWTRANQDSSSPLNGRVQDHLPGSLEQMRDDAVWDSTTDGLYLGDADSVDIILYSDASVARVGDTEDSREIGISYPTGSTATTNGTTNWGTISNPPEWGDMIGWRDESNNDTRRNRRECCSALVDLTNYYDNDSPISPDSLPLYGEYDYLKTEYNATISLVIVDYSSDYPRHSIEKAVISSIASIGGDWGDESGEEIAPNPDDPEGSGVGPRRASFVETFADIPPPEEIIQRERVNIGNSVSVATTNDEGDGAVVQGFSQPVLSNGTENIYWTGELRAFFIDEWGNFREDNPSDGTQGQLDGPEIDRAFELVFDEDDQIAKIQRLNLLFNGANEFEGTTDDGALVDAEFLNAIWDANTVLGSHAQSNIGSQRDYNTTAGTGASRYIFTWFDDDGDTVVEPVNLEIFEFEWIEEGSATRNVISGVYQSVILGSTAEYSGDGTDSDEGAERLINFIRGKEEPSWGFRSRTISGKTYLLGDIESSNPLQVLPPSADYTDGYDEFKEQYATRRRVTYVGANDGMLHAFNMGFWNSADNSFSTSAPSNYDGPTTIVPASHALGAEIWAYIPSNLTTSLGSLTRDDYTLTDSTLEPEQHYYFIDGSVVSFDAKVFADSATHPNGWGTILVAGTGYGGGSSNSRYVVFDITDPEQEPTLMMEISNPNLNMTTSKPDIVRYNDGGVLKWYLAFGSGTTNSATHTSSTGASFFLYDLSYSSSADRALTNTDRTVLSTALADRATDGFVGDVLTVDWNDADEFDNAVYFGTAEESFVATGSGDSQVITFTRNGDLRRLDLSDNTISVALRTSPEVPILNRPFAYIDEVFVDNNGTITSEFDNWLTVGSGKTITKTDLESTQQHYQFGIIEQTNSNGDPDSTTYGLTDLLNVTGVSVNTSGEVSGGVASGSTINTVEDLTDEIRTNSHGWYIQLDASDPIGSERTTTPAINYNEIIFFSSTVNATTTCAELVDSRLYSLDISTGVTYYSPDFEGVLGSDENGELTNSRDFGAGIVRRITLFGDQIIGPTDLGDIQKLPVNLPGEPGTTVPPVLGDPNGRKSWTEILF